MNWKDKRDRIYYGTKIIFMEIISKFSPKLLLSSHRSNNVTQKAVTAYQSVSDQHLHGMKKKALFFLL